MPPLYDQDDPDPGLRDTLLEVQRRYLPEVRDPDLKMQFLDRLVKTGKVLLNPQTGQITIRGGLGNDPWDTTEYELGQEAGGVYGGGAPGAHEDFRQRYPGLAAYGETDVLGDVMGRQVFGDEPAGMGPGRTLAPWEIDDWQPPLQGGEYAPWEGVLYPPETMNFAALRDPGLRQTIMQMSAQPRPMWDWETNPEPVARPTRSRVGQPDYGRGLMDAEGPVEALHNVPVQEVLPKVQELLTIYGGVNGAAQALADRHGGQPESWARAIARIQSGQLPNVNFDTADKIDVMLFSGQPVQPFDVPGFELRPQPAEVMPGYGGALPPEQVPGYAPTQMGPRGIPGFAAAPPGQDSLSLFGEQGILSYHPALDPRTWFQDAPAPTPQQSVLPSGTTLSELLPLLARLPA